MKDIRSLCFVAFFVLAVGTAHAQLIVDDFDSQTSGSPPAWLWWNNGTSGTILVDDTSGKREKRLHPDAEYAYKNVGLVIDYFANAFGRAGLLDRGADEILSSYVRFGNSKNAYWCNYQSYHCPQAGAVVYGAPPVAS